MVWLNNNLLTVNIDTTKFVPFSMSNIFVSPQGFPIAGHTSFPTANTWQCMSLCRVNCIKYQGVHIDDTLNWHRLIDNICSHVRKIICVTKKLLHVIERNTLRIVHQTLSKSVISYCIPVWGGAHKTDLLALIGAGSRQQVSSRKYTQSPARCKKNV